VLDTIHSPAEAERPENVRGDVSLAHPLQQALVIGLIADDGQCRQSQAKARRMLRDDLPTSSARVGNLQQRAGLDRRGTSIKRVARQTSLHKPREAWIQHAQHGSEQLIRCRRTDLLKPEVRQAGTIARHDIHDHGIRSVTLFTQASEQARGQVAPTVSAACHGGLPLGPGKHGLGQMLLVDIPANVTPMQHR
jgi:hypothetical protein